MSSNEPRNQLAPVGDLTDTLRNHAFIWNRDGMFCGGCEVPRTTPKSEFDHGGFERREFEDYEAYARHLAELVFTLLEGWRPPPRVIETADEFEALRPGSVVLHSPCSDTPMSACVWVKTGGWWESTGHDALYDGYDLESHRDEGETMTVLWEPEEAS